MFGRFLEGTHNLKRIVHVINYRLSKMAKAGSTILHPSTHDMWSLGDGKLPNLTKLVCWNVNGFRSVLKKGSLESLIQTTNPDILCFNETKVDLKAFLNDSLQSCLTGYSHYWNFCKVSSGYSGVAVCTKYKPLKVFEDFSLTNSCDNQSPESLEGRLLTLEFEKCYVVTVYKPNSGPSLNRLDFKIGYINLLKNYLLSIAQKKAVIVCGDMNVAHEEIDLARPEHNRNSAGFTKQERQSFDSLLKSGFVDCYRQENPTLQEYTWWSPRNRARDNNVGWRIDYFLVDQSLKGKFSGANILGNVMGSDHCPVELTVRFQ